MDDRQSSTHADKAANLKWLYEPLTKQALHRKGCVLCLEFFRHASEAVLAGDVTYIEACKEREGANSDFEKEIQRLKDRVRRRDDEIAQLRRQLETMHQQHGDEAMVIGDEHVAPADTRTSKKRRADDTVDRGSRGAGAPHEAASETPPPATSSTSGAASGPGVYASTSQGMSGFGGGHPMQPNVFAAPMPGTFMPTGMYASPAMYAPPGHPVVWPDGATWMPNDGGPMPHNRWGNAPNWAADWGPGNTYTSGARAMDNNWASSSRAPDWSNRPWDPPYDDPNIVMGIDAGSPMSAVQAGQPTARSVHASPSGLDLPRGTPTGPRATTRGRTLSRGTTRAGMGRRTAPPTRRPPVDLEIEAFLAEDDATAAPLASSSGGGASATAAATAATAAATEDTDEIPDVDEIRRMFEQVKIPGNENALRTLGRWRKKACAVLRDNRQPRHWLIVREYRRPHWAKVNDQTKCLPSPRSGDDAKGWHAYLRRYPGFKRRGLFGGINVSPMDDVVSYLRLARMVHVGPEKEWSQRKKVRDAFILTAAAILETPENYQRLLDQYRVRTNRLASTPDFGVRNLINEQTVVTHLARAGYTAYEAAAASHLSHAVLTDARYETGSQDSESEQSGSEDDPGNHGTPIVVDEP
ncbi:hypothetical protein FA95DRAFT_1612153, partial [Auriscalpium vulgare]